MNQLIDWLTQHPILLVLIGGWLLSALGGALNRKAPPNPSAGSRPPQQRVPQTQRPLQPVQPPPGQARVPGAAPQRARQPSADEIAAQIRRAMGTQPKDNQPKDTQPKQPARNDDVQVRDALVAARERTTQRRGEIERLRELRAARSKSLEERMAQKAAAQQKKMRQRELDRQQKLDRLGKLADRPRAELGAIAKLPGLAARPKLIAVARARRGRLLDLARPAAVVVQAEVLGAPRALRAWDYR